MSDPLPPRDERDETWFGAFFRAEHPAVLAYARRRVEDADDIVAEVFATAWRRRDDLPDPARPWLLRTAHHRILHDHRARRRRGLLSVRVASLWSGDGDEADLVADRADARALVADAMPSLSSGDQEILRLAAWEELDTAAIAVVLECSEAAARVRLHRARRRLRVLVERRTRVAAVTATGTPTPWRTS